MDTVQPSFNMPEPLSIGRSLIMTLEQFKSCISTCLKLFSSLNIFSHSILSPFNFAIVGCWRFFLLRLVEVVGCELWFFC